MTMDYTVWGMRELIERIHELEARERATVATIASIQSDGALCMDNMDDCRDMAQQFADAWKLQGKERAEFAKAAGFESVADMDTPRDNDTE